MSFKSLSNANLVTKKKQQIIPLLTKISFSESIRDHSHFPNTHISGFLLFTKEFSQVIQDMGNEGHYPGSRGHCYNFYLENTYKGSWLIV